MPTNGDKWKAQKKQDTPFQAWKKNKKLPKSFSPVPRNIDEVAFLIFLDILEYF
jgi:hypothetical protein